MTGVSDIEQGEYSKEHHAIPMSSFFLFWVDVSSLIPCEEFKRGRTTSSSAIAVANYQSET